MKVKSLEMKVKSFGKVQSVLFYFLLSTFYFLPLTFFGCGYQIIGSRHLPFNSVSIKPINNMTYEPKLEEKLHKALSEEFISQGIDVKTANGDVNIETKIKIFQLGVVAAVDENVYEQAITMRVDVKITGKDRTIEFISMESPIRITFESTGSVTDSVIQKERAIEKVCSEISSEIVGKVLLRYAE